MSCVLCGKGQKANPGQSGQRSTDKVQRTTIRKPRRGAWMFVLCTVSIKKGQNADNDDKGTIANKVQNTGD